jgi:hypothetical protein
MYYFVKLIFIQVGEVKNYKQNTHTFLKYLPK